MEAHFICLANSLKRGGQWLAWKSRWTGSSICACSQPVTLSLGLVYEERHHKLVAAVVVPASEMSGSVIVEDMVEAIEADARPFTKEERRSIKQAFIVPSQDGLAVCFRRKNGGEDFMPLDEKSMGKAWDKVNLKQSVVVRYKDGTKKLRIRLRKSWSVIDKIETLFNKTISFQNVKEKEWWA